MATEQIDAVGKIILAIAGIIMAYLQNQCRKDLDQAHAKIRELEGKGTGLVRKKFGTVRRLLYKENGDGRQEVTTGKQDVLPRDFEPSGRAFGESLPASGGVDQEQR